jgi:FUS-interacting serine-arginine-rich protein 1
MQTCCIMLYRIEDLKDIAERFGEVRDVYIPKNHYTQQPRGFAFIEFTDPKACEDASYDMQGLEIEGKPVRAPMPVGRAPK